MFRTTILAAVAALSFCAAAHAQTAPKGWKVETNITGWYATSPESVRLAYYPVAQSKASVVFWFEAEGLRYSYAYGKSVVNQASSVSTVDPKAGRLLAQSRTLLDAAGNQVAVLSYAWETPKGRQLAQIIMPVAASRSASYDTAFAQLTKDYKAGFAYTPEPPAQKPAGGS
ncbi:MAG TPA: hypothetical protein VG942_03025 [Hyphomonadaceae bacterium]|nr:hypothetical protein [Hyphomonadaceae bacterium]